MGSNIELALAVAEVAMMELAHPLPWWSVLIAGAFIIIILVVVFIPVAWMCWKAVCAAIDEGFH